MACKFSYTYDLLEVTSSEAWERGAAGPSFDVSAPRNVTALKDANAYLHCIVNNLANKTVSMQQRDLNTNISNQLCLAGVVGSCADAVVCWLMQYIFDPIQGLTFLCCVHVVVCGS